MIYLLLRLLKLWRILLMADVINLTKYRHDREKAIDERIANAERRINELHILIYAWKILKHE